MREGWLNSQRRDFMIEVNVGSWSGHNTREMAEQAGCETLYKYAYLPFSGVAHSMWQHIAIYNLKPCANALHKRHRIPTVAHVPLDPDYVYRSAKYVTRSYELFDCKRSIDAAIDDGGGDEVMAKPIGDSLPNTKAGGLRSRRRFGQWGVC
jgi:hypothetical protein